VVECAGLEDRNPATTSNVPTDSCNSAEIHLSPNLSLKVTNHPELAELIRAWPDLPEALRRGITAMVKSAKST
jgi:hypothetical protein